MKGTNYLANMRYCLLLYTRQCILLAIEMQIKPRAIHLSCHNSSSSGGRTEYCSSSSKSLMKLSTRHMKSAWDGYAACMHVLNNICLNAGLVYNTNVCLFVFIAHRSVITLYLPQDSPYISSYEKHYSIRPKTINILRQQDA